MRYGGERGGGGQKSEKTKVGNWQRKARNQSWPLALAPKHQGPLERLWYDMNPSLSSQFSNSSLQVPFGMAIVMTPQAGQKGSPHCSSWVISWVPEDTSPKKEIRQVSQRSAPRQSTGKKTKYYKKNLRRGSCRNNSVKQWPCQCLNSCHSQRKRAEPGAQNCHGSS